MKFINLIRHAANLGYEIDTREYYSTLIFQTNDSLKIEMRIPNDKIKNDLDDLTNIDWEYKIRNKDENLIHSDWFDYYYGNAETKLQNMQEDILKYINNFATKRFNIIEKSTITLYGKKFLKHMELVFE